MKIIISIALFFMSATLLAQKFVADYRGVDRTGTIMFRGDNTFFYDDLPQETRCSLRSNSYIGNYEIKGDRVKLTTLPRNRCMFNAIPFIQHDSSKLVIKFSDNMLSKFQHITMNTTDDKLYFSPDKNGIIEIKWNDYEWQFSEETRKFATIMLKTENCYAYPDIDTLVDNGYVIDYNDSGWKKNNDLPLCEEFYFEKNTFEFKKIEQTLKLVKTTVKHRLMKKLKLVK
jgi:hypothetical protein